MTAPRIFALLMALLLAVGGHWFYRNFDYQWDMAPVLRPEWRGKPMLAAMRWAELNGYRVSQLSTLRASPVALPRGVLLLENAIGQLDAPSGERLWRWVENGNVLVMRYVEGDDDAEDDCARNNLCLPLTVAGTDHVDCTRHPTTRLRLPGMAYPLTLNACGPSLAVDDVRVLAVDEHRGSWLLAAGRGHILLQGPRQFEVNSLGQHDHAELLLHLLRLAGPGANLVVVESLGMPPWYVLLWQRFDKALVVGAVLLLLLLWARARRFGPLLPDPEQPRRAILEHIDAAGRWLWGSASGRERLLSEVRDALQQHLLRRAPALTRLQAGELLQQLERDTGIPLAQLQQALYAPAASTPAEFCNQIQYLQRVRQHYER